MSSPGMAEATRADQMTRQSLDENFRIVNMVVLQTIECARRVLDDENFNLVRLELLKLGTTQPPSEAQQIIAELRRELHQVWDASQRDWVTVH